MRIVQVAVPVNAEFCFARLMNTAISAREAVRVGQYVNVDLHVHDLRHTVGMRLREAIVPKTTVADSLWHEHRSITANYSVGQIDEPVGALGVIADENGRGNKTLQMLQLEARKRAVA